MTKRQKLEIERSKKVQRLNELLALEGDALTTEVRNEMEALTDRLPGLEIEMRAAITAEAAEEAESRGMFGNNGDGESAEVRQLLDRTPLTAYFGPASAGTGIEGRAAELNAALKVPAAGSKGGPAVPWELLELRAFTTTAANDGPEMQRPILQRLFGPGVLDTLGVRLDTVPAGRSEWPIVTGGVAPAQAKEGTAAAAAVTAVFSYASLKPKRLTGRYEYTHEAAASVPDLEQGLRRDLADAVKSAMSNLIINGVAPTNANPQNVEGFLTKLAGADLSAAEAAATDYGRLHSLGVDGIHAEMETQVSSVIGDETYQHAAGVYIAGSGESGSELLRRRSGGCYASTYIPAASGMKQAAILHAAGPNGGTMRGDSVAAMWPTLEVVRDIYSQASQGVILTWISQWDAHTVLRAAAYKQRDIQIA